MRRTLLLADDSVTIRKVVELAFHDTDIRVVAVGSGREALERLAEIAPDIVLADVVMPGPSGYEICRTVKLSSRPVPVLLLAGTFEPFDAAHAQSCGADGQITKPFDSRSLVERVARLLDPREAPSPVSIPTHDTTQDADVEALFDDLAAPLPTAAPPQPAPTAASVTPSAELASGDVDAIVRAVVERLSERVVREIAWDVVPDIAEAVVRERLRQLERESD